MPEQPDRAKTPVYLVVGAAGGIGTELVRRLASRGARLVLAGRTGEKLQDLGRKLEAETAELDASDFEATDSLVRRIAESQGRLDGAVNLAGSILLKPAHLVTRKELDETIVVNLVTAFSLVRAAAPVMQKQGGGSIVLMSSCAARVGLANHEAIAAAKAGVQGLAVSAASTYASGGVRVNAVAPGLVETPLSERITSNEASLKASVAMHPLGRIGATTDIAPVIDWLLGPESGWVTGQVIGVDGGIATVRGRPGR